MRNFLLILKNRLSVFFDRTNKKNPLGRWAIENCQKKINYKIDMSNEDTMYSHSVTGSGTYYVGGLCVAARTNETWDYVNMKPIDGVVTIVNNNPDGRIRNYQRVIDINHDENEHSCWCPDDQHWKNHWRFK
jgi:hypothetical protein